MKYLIIGDSSTNLSADECKHFNAKMAPLSIRIDDVEYIDDESLDIKDFVYKLANTPDVPKSSCPSTQTYIDLFEKDVDGIFVVTLSSKLSGSYNSAMLAKTMYNEKHPDVKIHVFDSRSAGPSQYLLAHKLAELCKAEYDFDEIVDRANKYYDNTQLLFVLDNITSLEKNGRMSKMKAKLANILNLKLILKQTEDGHIDLAGKARGSKKTISKMVQSMSEYKDILPNARIAIFHCEALEKANYVKKLIEKEYGKIANISIVEMYGLNATYAQIGGILLAF